MRQSNTTIAVPPYQGPVSLWENELKAWMPERIFDAPPAGFYSALSPGIRTVVTYSERKAVVAPTVSPGRSPSPCCLAWSWSP